MVTKEILLEAKASVNEAALRIMQSYTNSPSVKKLFFVVEGKDDIPFYASKADTFISKDWTLTIIPAGNRNKAIEAYKSLNWAFISKDLVYFFIDRDLSDYTQDDTPSDSNVYITTKYAIENELCTEDTFLRALKYYFDLNDIDEKDEQAISTFYNLCWQQFVEILKPIMSQILYWKLNSINANYANFKVQRFFEVTLSGIRLQQGFQSAIDILPDLFLQSNVAYTPIDTTQYTDLLSSKHSPDEYIRGKYILAFFSKTLSYVSRNSDVVLPSQKKAKINLSIGYEDVVIKLCGIMRIPNSLQIFFGKMKDNLSGVKEQKMTLSGTIARCISQ